MYTSNDHILHTIYTTEIPYYGDDGLDITVKGQHGMGKYFAPTWNMVWGIKKNTLTEAAYTEQYERILSNVPIHVWDWFLRRETRTLMCYCKQSQFCHRDLLVSFLLRTFGDRIIFGGYKGDIY